MHARTSHRHGSARHAWSRDRIEYRLLVTLSFFICLAMALAARLAGQAGTGSQSMVAQAKANAHAAIGYAFHG